MASITGGEVLDELEIVDGRVVFKHDRFRRVLVGAGTPVPIVRRNGLPYYKLGGHYLNPAAVIKTLRKQDAYWLDSHTQRKPAALSDRDYAILQRLNNGETYEAIGADYGLTRQRIQQIATKLANLGHYVSTKEVRAAKQASYAAARADVRHGAARHELDASLHAYLKRRILTLRNKSRQLGLRCDLTVDDLLPFPTHCPALGIPLVWGTGERGVRDDSPSIDRLDPSKGYVRGNIVVVSFKANRIKTDATPDDIRKVADFYQKLMT